jgi:DNA-binding transcriptional MerR regulator
MSALPQPAPMLTTAELSRLSGASKRQLQWWDDGNLLCSEAAGHRLFFDATDLPRVHLIMALRKKRVGFRVIRLALRIIDRDAPQPPFFVLIVGQTVQLVRGAPAVVEAMKLAKGGAVVTEVR